MSILVAKRDPPHPSLPESAGLYTPSPKSRSLAGLRVGFAIGHADLIGALERVKNSFNSYPLDSLAMAGAIAALEDKAHFERTRKAVITRALVSALEALGFEVLPSVETLSLSRSSARC